jgi:hypothetical protein
LLFSKYSGEFEGQRPSSANAGPGNRRQPPSKKPCGGSRAIR